MSTCGPWQQALGSFHKGIPELFFVTTAIKVCYGKFPRWEETGESAQDNDLHALEKTPRTQSLQQGRQDRRDTIDAQYSRVYCDLRTCALNDIKRIVREYVENVSTASKSFEFMNIYGLCSFDPPKRILHSKDESANCRFTNVSHLSQGDTPACATLVAVRGVLNPLMSSRVQHGELELTHCRDSDYYEALNEFTRLHSRNRMKAWRAQVHLGSTIGSMENGFIFTVREDLHNIGCTYRQMVALIELLHLNIIHYLHS